MAPILTVSIYHTIFNIFTLHITGKLVQVLLCPEANCYILKLNHSQQTKDGAPKIHKSNLQDSCLYLGLLRFSTSKKVSNFQSSAFMCAQNSWDLQFDWSDSSAVFILSQAGLQENIRIRGL